MFTVEPEGTEFVAEADMEVVIAGLVGCNGKLRLGNGAGFQHSQ